MTRWTRSVVVSCLLSALAIRCYAATEPDTLTTARDLYASAAYEEALATLDRLRASAALKDAPSIDQYRAFCLMALGRSVEAQTAIEAVVAADPLFRPSEAEVSPRVRTAFTDVRRRLLPGIVEKQYAQAKQAFDQLDFQAAADGFLQVLAILNDPVLDPIAAQPRLVDLKTLASGFQELSARLTPPPPLPQSTNVPPASPAIQPPALSRIYSAADSNVSPPTILRQELPVFSGRVPSSRGTLEVVIDERGAVESASMRTSISPAYDKLALAATRAWRYMPAAVDGMPVKFRKAIQISITPGPQ